MMKLGGYVQCTKISPEWECQSQRSKVKVTVDKKNEKCGILFGICPLVRGPRAALFSGAVLGSASTPMGKSAHAV